MQRVHLNEVDVNTQCDRCCVKLVINSFTRSNLDVVHILK